jgi:GNAT superfamily N-acetyltransferase
VVDDYRWAHDVDAVDLAELSEMYRIAPLGEKPPDTLATVFGNSMFACFAYAGDVLAGAGRVLADGLDCAYIADVAVHPQHQGRGLGKAIIRRLVALSQGHKKIILYVNPGTEGFYRDLGFLRMNTVSSPISRPSLVTVNACPASTASMISSDLLRRSRSVISSRLPIRPSWAPRVRAALPMLQAWR